MAAMQAQDTFLATLDDGTERLITKGEVLPASHELVRRDAKASKDNPDRTALFRELDLGENDDKPAARPPRASSSKGGS